MPQRTLTSTELEQLVLGACLLGGGGGGPLSGAQPLLDYLRRNRLTVTLAGLADLPADTPGSVVAGIGAPNAASQSGDFTEAPLNAFRRYAKLLDTPPGAVLPAEVGAMNSLIPAVVAAQTGLPLIDADSAGRALPTLNLAAFNLAAPPSPLLLANQPAAGQEGVSITLNAANASQTDSLVRANLSATDDTGYSLFGSVGAFSTWALTPAQLAHSSVTGSTSRATQSAAITTAETTASSSLVHRFCSSEPNALANTCRARTATAASADRRWRHARQLDKPEFIFNSFDLYSWGVKRSRVNTQGRTP